MWTKTLQQQTKEYFETHPAGMMKQFKTDRFGIGASRVDGTCIVFDLETKEEFHYDTIDELLKDGWAID